MIEELFLRTITGNLGSNYRQVQIAIQHCELKGRLTIHEVMQLDNQGLPISRIIRTIFHMQPDHSIEMILIRYHITYSDLMCIIGIIAQDVALKQQGI